ncbi:RNA polymerase subunit sigma-70 [Actinobacteria bacterium YIM 96077]|uniref:RNA polymerase subunit sigma-70 n=1 Tax=Phytoactinopolyspora halophila TaxID=1981511 RepID=A0A329R2U4_9ACTN|nr:RNA polymerase subunit sigma-70 [Actinobacteria bacterium YIM 96077]RAW18964.1 RNA polymerase subunit sigma-70 [Phytoactinopolyspora halophila]
MQRPDPDRQAEAHAVAETRFPPDLMYAAARLYYLEDANQAEVARRLSTSRATVSRLLSEARRQGIVRIDVVFPEVVDSADLAARVASALDLERVYLSQTSASAHPGRALAPALSEALESVGLASGDVLLVSSGRTVYEAAQFELPRLPGVMVAPTVGGQDEPEAWYQTNEITREVAYKIGGRPTFLYAPALPGADLYASLLDDPSIRRVLELWKSATCVVTGVGAPPLTRNSIPAFIPTDAASLRTAVADVCCRFYDREGKPVEFPGSDRLMATGLDVLQDIPYGIGVAVGADKVGGIIAGAHAGYFNHLVTDPETAAMLLSAAEKQQHPSSPSR